jgi:hypothetical protein
MAARVTRSFARLVVIIAARETLDNTDGGLKNQRRAPHIRRLIRRECLSTSL